MLEVSPASHKRLQNMLADLGDKRQELLRQQRLAYGYGDLRENADYSSITQKLHILNRQYEELLGCLQRVRVVHTPARPSVIGPFSSFTITSCGGETRSFQLTTSFEADTDRGWVPATSGLGMAVRGLTTGDTVN